MGLHIILVNTVNGSSDRTGVLCVMSRRTLQYTIVKRKPEYGIMSTRRVRTIIGVQIRYYRRLRWFAVFYDSLHPIRAGLDYIISLE